MEDQNKQQFQRTSSYHPGEDDNQPKQSKFKQKISKINHWLKTHPRKSLLLLVIFMIAVGSCVILALGGGSFSVVTTPAKSTEPKRFYSSLTGLEISEQDANRPATAVMIENSPDARPQSGLKQAGLVFESVAEGGITRFLVLYHEDKPKLIGPVRSIRPQFASFAAAYDAGVAHVGGSQIPLKKLRSGKIKDLDQFFNPDTYWRATDRYAPHNVYTSISKLDALNKAKKYTSSSFSPWERNKKAVAAKTPNAKNITVPVSEGLFAVKYSWDKAKNNYKRSQGGAAHTDREHGQITPKVVVVMQVPHNVIRDSNNYSYPDISSKGKAWVFQGGSVKEVSWSKKDDKSQIVFTTNEGKPYKLDPGQTWVTAIAKDKKPTWK